MKQTSNFENLECWRLAEDLAVDVYKISMRGNLRRELSFRDQIQKSALSIASNIAEGKERESTADLIRFLYYAKGSAGELWTQLRIAYKIGLLNKKEFQDLCQRILKIMNLIGGLIRAIKQRSPS